jgi:TRAF3-interacting protein 1
MEVIRATGFASGLYSPEESDSANVSEKEQKIVFLEKIIKVVGLQLNTLVVANPGKIIAGKDPQDTNNLLQLLAVAAKNLPDSSAAVRTVLGDAGGPMSAPAPSVAAVSKPAPQQQREREVEKEIEERPAPKVRHTLHLALIWR